MDVEGRSGMLGLVVYSMRGRGDIREVVGGFWKSVLGGGSGRAW